MTSGSDWFEDESTSKAYFDRGSAWRQLCTSLQLIGAMAVAVVVLYVLLSVFPAGTSRPVLVDPDSTFSGRLVTGKG